MGAGTSLATTTDRPGRRTRRRSGTRRDALLVAAESVFAEHGYQAATVQQIATAAGTTVPTLYNHFGSKPGLLVAVVVAALEAMSDPLSTDAVDLQQPLDAILTDWITLTITVSLDRFDPVTWTQILGDSFSMVHEIGPRYAEIGIYFVRKAEALLDRLAATGRLAPDLDRSAAAKAMDAVAVQVLRNGLVAQHLGHDAIRAEVAGMVRVLARGWETNATDHPAAPCAAVTAPELATAECADAECADAECTAATRAANAAAD